MKLNELFEDDDTLELPDLSVGDILLTGKFKNRKAEIKGFEEDPKTGMPIAKTTKGDQQIFKPRISKLHPDFEAVEENIEEPLKLSKQERELIEWATATWPTAPSYGRASVNASDSKPVYFKALDRLVKKGLATIIDDGEVYSKPDNDASTKFGRSGHRPSRVDRHVNYELTTAGKDLAP